MTIRKLCNLIIVPVWFSIFLITPSHLSDKMIYGASPFGDPDRAVIFTAGGNTFQFDVDYAIVGGNQGETVVKNSDAIQQTVVVKRGLHVTGGVTPVIGQQADGVFHLFVTKDKIKVSQSAINFGKVYDLENIVDNCKELNLKCFVFDADIPTKERKGTYNLVFAVQFNNAELEKFYITKIVLR